MDPFVGEQIGPYVVRAKIGQGGIGEVFLVELPDEGARQWALKRLRADRVDDSKYREKFIKEVATTKQLIHPHIVPIEAVGEEKIPWYAMPFYADGTLKDLLIQAVEKEKEGVHASVYSIGRFMPLFLQACEAVAHAHRQGIIHRDLKPSNILIGKEHAFVADWSLSGYTEGFIEGTISYLPPEVLGGKSPTEKADIYALGLILYQILTLRFPFHREDIPQFLQTWQHETILDPLKVAPHRKIPPKLAEIALGCVAETYQGMEGLLSALNQVEMPIPFEGRTPYEILTLKTLSLPLQKIQRDHKRKPQFIELERIEESPSEVQELSYALDRSFEEKDIAQVKLLFDTTYAHSPCPLPILIQEILALIKLGPAAAQEKIAQLKKKFLDVQAIAQLRSLQTAALAYQGESFNWEFLEELPRQPTYQHLLPVFFILEAALSKKNTRVVYTIGSFLIKQRILSLPLMIELDFYILQALKLDGNSQKIKDIINFYDKQTDGKLPSKLRSAINE